MVLVAADHIVHYWWWNRLDGAAMSLINQMLQDLEKRQTTSDENELIGHIRAVDRVNNNALWKIIAAGALIVVAVLTWLLLQVRQTPSVPPPASGIVMPKPEAVAKAETQPITPAAQEKLPEKAPETTVVAPAPIVAATPAPAIIEEKKPVQEKPIEKPLDLDVKKQLQPKQNLSAVKTKPAVKAKQPKAVQQPVVVANKEVIEKHDRPLTTQQRADEEFRKATLLLNQGRVNEAMQGFRNALSIDKNHEASRQALLGLLIESKQLGEAQKLLQDALKQNPNQSGYAMVLARIQIDQGNLDGAIDTLKKYAASAANNPDYHGFAAALYQRKGDHKQAFEQYQAALRLSPQTTVWLMGLGISLQSLQRYNEAYDAFTAAKAAGNLTPDLQNFVDQRLAQLQNLHR
jgi:MSHA biogenesis protein MshN